MIRLDVFLQRLPAGFHGGKCLGVDRLRLQVPRNGTAEILLREHHGPVHEVAQHGNQFGVVPALEVFPGEVVVLGLRGIGREDVAQHVFLSGEIPFVFIHPYGPAAGGGNLVAFQIQELIGRHIVRQDIVSIGLQHGREHNAVEHNIVLADKVNQPGFRVFPPLLPAFRKEFLGVGDIADGGVEPDVKHLAFRAFYRNGNTPVQVAGDGTGEKAAVQPALALAVHIGFPLLMLLQDPVAEPGLVLVQGKVPVLGFLLHRHGAAQARLRFQQLFRRKGGTTLLALVAVGMRIAALGADSLDEAVCQEHFGLLVIELLRLLDNEIVLVVELAEELGSILRMHLGRGPGINVEVDPKARKGVLHDFVVLVHDILRRDTLVFRLDGDGHAVLVAAADKQHILSPHAEVTDIDVAGDVGTGQVADMDRTVGIGECTGHESSFMAHFFNLPSLILMVFLISLMRPRRDRSSIWSSAEVAWSIWALSSSCCTWSRLSWKARMARGT